MLILSGSGLQTSDFKITIRHYPSAWTCVDHSVIVVLAAFGHRAREFLDVRIWLFVLEASARLQQALDSHVDL